MSNRNHSFASRIGLMEYLSFVNLKSFSSSAQEVCKVLELIIIGGWGGGGEGGAAGGGERLHHNQSWS